MSPIDFWNAMDAQFTQIFPDIKVPAGPLTEAELDAAISRQDAQAIPKGLEDRIEEAIKRIVDGHAPRRIPADPTDVDLVLAEVLALIRGNWPPFWINPQPEQKDAVDEYARLHEIAHRDSAVSVTVRADDLRAILAARQPVGQEPVAYLDIGAGGYTDVGSDLTAEQLALLPKGRHMLAIIGTYGVDGYVAAPDQRAAQAEQQGAGDARAQFEAWAAGRGWKLSPYQNNCGIVVSEKYGHPGVQRCWEAWQAALAARQPVWQEPAAWMDPDGSRVLTAKAKADASSAYRTATAGYSVPLYAAPPAQVDLEQFRCAVVTWRNMGEAVHSPEQMAEANRILALIDQQAGGAK